MNEKILTFFNLRFDELCAAMRKSASASSATKGTARETAVGTALDQVLPPIARRMRGDIFDAAGASTGQLDTVLVHQTSPVLDFGDQNALIPAEGVVAVVECKSNLAKQWSEVERTWEKLRTIRRQPPLLSLSSLQNEERTAIPFFVFGLDGWTTESSMEDAARGLRDAFGENCPPVFVVALTQRLVAGAVGNDYLKGWRCEEHMRGWLLAHCWATLSESARGVLMREIPWAKYFGIPT